MSLISRIIIDPCKRRSSDSLSDPRRDRFSALPLLRLYHAQKPRFNYVSPKAICTFFAFCTNEFAHLNAKKRQTPQSLFQTLRCLAHKYDINLNAIMSRPMKTEMGKYKFFFECSLSPSQIYRLDEIADILKKECRVLVEILGIYNLIK